MGISSSAAPGLHEPPKHPSEPLHHPQVDEIELPAVLHALSDPMRLQIVKILAQARVVRAPA